MNICSNNFQIKNRVLFLVEIKADDQNKLIKVIFVSDSQPGTYKITFFKLSYTRNSIKDIKL